MRFGSAADISRWTFIGFWIAYQWDCPIGPTDVGLLGIIYALAFALKGSCPPWAVKAELTAPRLDLTLPDQFQKVSSCLFG